MNRKQVVQLDDGSKNLRSDWVNNAAQLSLLPRLLSRIPVLVVFVNDAVTMTLLPKSSSVICRFVYTPSRVMHLRSPLLPSFHTDEAFSSDLSSLSDTSSALSFVVKSVDASVLSRVESCSSSESSTATCLSTSSPALSRSTWLDTDDSSSATSSMISSAWASVTTHLSNRADIKSVRPNLLTSQFASSIELAVKTRQQIFLKPSCTQ